MTNTPKQYQLCAWGHYTGEYKPFKTFATREQAWAELTRIAEAQNRHFRDFSIREVEA